MDSLMRAGWVMLLLCLGACSAGADATDGTGGDANDAAEDGGGSTIRGVSLRMLNELLDDLSENFCSVARHYECPTPEISEGTEAGAPVNPEDEGEAAHPAWTASVTPAREAAYLECLEQLAGLTAQHTEKCGPLIVRLLECTIDTQPTDWECLDGRAYQAHACMEEATGWGECAGAL